MKRTFKIIGLGIIIFIIGGLGGLFINYVVLTKVSTHPTWSQNSIIKALDNRIKIIKTVEKIIVADNESIADIASRAAGTVAYVETINQNGDTVRGNGVILSSDGIIVTDKSIVSEDDSMFIFVKLSDDNVYDVKDTYFDTYTQLVFLKIDAQNLATSSFANSDDARSGKRLISIARPKSGNDEMFAVGGFFGRENIFSVSEPTSDYLQGVLTIDFSRDILSKSVGSPVVDFQGNMLGMIAVSQLVDEDGIDENFYAVAANDIRTAFDSFLQDQELANDIDVRIENTLGINYTSITAVDAYSNDIDITSGAVVTGPDTYEQQSSFANAKAIKSGLQAGDIIVSVNNDMIDEKNNLSRLMYKNREAQTITLKVFRNNEMLSIEIAE